MLKSFRNTALVGYVAMVLPLTAVTAISINRLESRAAEEVQKLRAAENEISLAHRLRADAELLVSAGRGYLITSDKTLLTSLQQSETDFDETLVALRQRDLSPTGRALVEQADEAARTFRQVQSDILSKRRNFDRHNALVWRFEAELLPSSNALGQSLDRLVEYKERGLDAAYLEAQRERSELATWIYTSLLAVTLLSLGLAWRFVSLLARSYRKEQEALAAARDAVAARDELMGIVAHDLRNPLNSIALKAALLTRSAATDRAREHASSIGDVTKTMADLISRLLDVSTLEAGCFSVSPAACDGASLLSQTLDTFANLAASKKIRLQQFQSEPDLVLMADRARILQVLSNLLGNALKVTPSGGEIGVRLERDGHEAHFCVWDTGPGIRAEHVPHLFDRRWKHEVGGAQGTGLGLFIVKGVIDAHGGRIWVNSEAKRGAEFHFTLPLAENGEQAPSSALHRAASATPAG